MSESAYNTCTLERKAWEQLEAETQAASKAEEDKKKEKRG